MALPDKAADAALVPVLARLAAGETLSEAEAEAVFGAIMRGEATDGQIGALLMALAMRGETVAELAGAVRAMRAHMLPVAGAEDALDVCGTGGDRLGTLNVSTACAFVVAGAGVPVAKHGNRSASSRSGGADVLAALGVRLDPPLARLGQILREAGIVFLFAPRHHAGLAHAAAVRRGLGMRTLFNLLGPLANPAGVRRQLTGVFSPFWVQPVAEALGRLGTARAWVVHGQGMDELCLDGENEIVVLDGTETRQMRLSAASLGLRPAPIATIEGGDASENAECLLDLLHGKLPRGEQRRARALAYRDTVVLNAAAALMVADKADDLAAALRLAAAALDGGAALDRLARLRAAAAVEPAGVA